MRSQGRTSLADRRCWRCGRCPSWPRTRCCCGAAGPPRGRAEHRLGWIRRARRFARAPADPQHLRPGGRLQRAAQVVPPRAAALALVVATAGSGRPLLESREPGSVGLRGAACCLLLQQRHPVHDDGERRPGRIDGRLAQGTAGRQERRRKCGRSCSGSSDRRASGCRRF
jgi:hypothetical protein